MLLQEAGLAPREVGTLLAVGKVDRGGGGGVLTEKIKSIGAVCVRRRWPWSRGKEIGTGERRPKDEKHGSLAHNLGFCPLQRSSAGSTREQAAFSLRIHFDAGKMGASEVVSILME